MGDLLIGDESTGTANQLSYLIVTWYCNIYGLFIIKCLSVGQAIVPVVALQL